MSKREKADLDMTELAIDQLTQYNKKALDILCLMYHEFMQDGNPSRANDLLNLCVEKGIMLVSTEPFHLTCKMCGKVYLAFSPVPGACEKCESKLVYMWDVAEELQHEGTVEGKEAGVLLKQFIKKFCNPTDV